MTTIPYRTALIVGAGPGISASVARGLAAAGLKVGVAARDIEKLAPLADAIGAVRFAVDASDPAAVAHLFEDADARLGVPDVVLYNASARVTGPIAEIEPARFAAIGDSAYGGFLVVQQAARRMIPRGAALFCDRCQCQRQGLSALSRLCHGQVCPAGSGAKYGARTGTKGHSRGTFRDRRRGAQRATPGSRGSAGQHARSRCDRSDLPRNPAPTPQRLVPGGRIAALGREVLNRRVRGAADPARGHFATDALGQPALCSERS